MVKTLFLFEVLPEESFFFELEGDYSRLQGILINSDPEDGFDPKLYEKLSQELNEIVYDANGRYKVTQIDKPTKDWDHFVKCGFAL